MAHAPLFAALAALAIITLVWQPIVALAIIVVALAGRGLCRLIGVGGERFFIGSGTGTARHHHPTERPHDEVRRPARGPPVSSR